MSGGVDSAVAALLLKEQGYDVHGVHLKLSDQNYNKCCDLSSFKKVVALCHQLDIPLTVLDYSDEFKELVYGPFLEDYAAGLTPNPCINCNKYLKIGRLLEWALSQGFDYLATGHYAKIENGSIFMAADKKKDQSYFLWTLKQDQLKHLLFPLGELSKQEVRLKAMEASLPMADSQESYDVCFIPDDDTKGFLQKHLTGSHIKPGDVTDTTSTVIGSHIGLPLYTIGQRHGFVSVNNTSESTPLYVISKDVVNNRLVVGSKEEASVKSFWIGEPNFLDNPLEMTDLKVRIRHLGGLIGVREIRVIGEIMEVDLEAPAFAVAAGQSAVFYKGEELVGGGVIC